MVPPSQLNYAKVTSWGWFLIVAWSVSFIGLVFAAIVSKLLPSSDNPVISAIQNDSSDVNFVSVMANPSIQSGVLVTLEDLHPSSSFLRQGSSLRVTGKLQEYTVETAIAIICHGNASLKIDTQHLRDLSVRIGSIYQFIGELLIQPDNEPILQARVGRNVDGIDLNLYQHSIQLLRQFQADHMKNVAT